MNENKILKGKILVYRVFDIGEEINLEIAGRILQETNRSKFKLKKNEQQSVIVSNEPLLISLGPYAYEEQGHRFAPEVNAKLWSFGTLSLVFEYTIPENTTIKQLNEWSTLIQNHEQLDTFARSKARELSLQIKESMAKITEWNSYEDYVIYFIEKFAQQYQDAGDILLTEDIASLILSEEGDNLAIQIKERIYSNKLQYYKNDLAIIDWNSAFVIEPNGSMDVPNVLEFAINQLLEMRYYDDLLDEKLQDLYSAAELKSMRIFSSEYTNLALEASQRYIEIAEIVETVENSLKVIGDIYHATVFRTASSKFRFSDWQSSIDNKLNNMAQLSGLLLDNVTSRRSHLLEIVIILLISIELIPFAFQVYGMMAK